MKLDKTFFEKRARVLGLMVCDALIIVFCAFAALLTKSAPNIPETELNALSSWLHVLVILYVGVYAVFRMYRVLWRYSDSMQFAKLAMSTIVASGLTVAVNLIAQRISGSRPLPNNLLIINAMFVLVGVCAFRLTLRMIKQYYTHTDTGSSLASRRIMVVGAGEAGSHLVEMFASSRNSLGTIEVIVDDDPLKAGFLIGDVPVAGCVNDIPALVDTENITDIIIALPTAPRSRIKEITDICLETGCYVRIMDRLKKAEDAEA